MAYDLIAIFALRDGALDKAAAILAAAVPLILREDGCLSYRAVKSDEGQPRLFTIESWRDKAALDAHLARASTKAMLADLKPLMEGEDDLVPVTTIGD